MVKAEDGNAHDVSIHGDNSWIIAMQSVLGSCLIDPDYAVPLVMASAKPEHFVGQWRSVYKAIVSLVSEGKPVDPVVVVDQLGSAYKGFIFELMRVTPTAANVSEYLPIIAERSRFHAIKDIGEQLGTAFDLKEAVELVEKAVDIAADSESSTGVNAGDAVSEWWDDYNSGHEPEYIPTGIGCLDSVLDIEAGHLIILAGYPSHGKSAIAIQIAWAMSQQKKVGFFCYETSLREWTNRLLSMTSGVKLNAIKHREISAEDLKPLADSSAQIYKRSLCYEDAAGMSVSDIQARCLQKGYEVAIVDYLQLVEPPTKKFGAVQEISDISKGLRIMAKKRNIAVLALSQLSREIKSNDEWVPLPNLRDLRGSGQIEQDADAVVVIHAPLRMREPRWRYLSIVKNRHGEVKTFFADFRGSVQTFFQPDPMLVDGWKELAKTRGKKKNSDPAPATSSGKPPSDYNRTLDVMARQRREAERNGEKWRPGFLRREDDDTPKQEDFFALAEKFPDIVKIQN